MRQVSFQRGIITQLGVTCIYFTFSCISLWPGQSCRHKPSLPAPVLGPTAGSGQQGMQAPSPGLPCWPGFPHVTPGEFRAAPISPLLQAGSLLCWGSQGASLAGTSYCATVLPTAQCSVVGENSGHGPDQAGHQWLGILAMPPRTQGPGNTIKFLGLQQCHGTGCCMQPHLPLHSRRVVSRSQPGVWLSPAPAALPLTLPFPLQALGKAMIASMDQ